MQTSAPSDHAYALIGGSPEAQIMRMICGYRVSQVIRAFAQFGIADLLAEAPKAAATLGEAASVDPNAIGRLLRAGATMGLVTIDDDGSFRSTPLLQVLQTGAASSMHGFALGYTAPSAYLPFGRLTEAIRTGKPQARAALGCDFFEHFSANTTDKAHFTAAMHTVSESIAEQLSGVIDASHYASGVDVGGATGILIRRLVEANPGLKGIVFEREQVAEIAAAAIKQAGLDDAVSVVTGDFFEAVPEADLYVLKWILHDWDDAHCVQILCNCRAAMRSGGSVVLIEMAIDDPSNAWFASMVDMAVLAFLGSRERTLEEYDDLLGKAGLTRGKVTDVQSHLGRFHVIEAQAAS